MSAVLELDDQLARAFHRPDLLDQPHVLPMLAVADTVAQATLDRLAAHRGHELVTAHPDVPSILHSATVISLCANARAQESVWW